MRTVFLLAKDPLTMAGGDLTLQQVLMDLARDLGHEVSVVCLSPHVTKVEHTPGVVRVPKEPVRLARLGLRSLRSGRSILHERYLSAPFTEVLDDLDAEVFVSDHGYMAEPFLASRHADGPARLLVSTTIQESMVWAETRGLAGRLEARRIERDELRVARVADGLGTYDEDEAAAYRQLGIPRVTWLDVTIPPTTPVDLAATPPRLVFLGHREWPPNARGAELIRSWWPRISAGIPGAELWIVGPPPPGGVGPSGGGIRDLGFVEDLDAVLNSSRALAAPIDTGGGVRVKILDAASRGLPVVSTTAGVGSLAGLFGLTPYDDPESFVRRCRELLQAPEEAVAAGARLHAANVAHWDSGRPRDSVAAWLGS